MLEECSLDLRGVQGGAGGNEEGRDLRDISEQASEGLVMNRIAL